MRPNSRMVVPPPLSSSESPRRLQWPAARTCPITRPPPPIPCAPASTGPADPASNRLTQMAGLDLETALAGPGHRADPRLTRPTPGCNRDPADASPDCVRRGAALKPRGRRGRDLRMNQSMRASEKQAGAGQLRSDTNACGAAFTCCTWDRPSLASARPSLRLDATMTLPARSRANLAAANWSTVSSPSRPSWTVRCRPRICPSIRRRRALTRALSF